MFKTLKSVFFVLFSGLIAFLLVVFLLVALPLIKSSVISNVENDVLNNVSALSKYFGKYLYNSQLLQEKAKEFSAANGYRVSVILPNGKVIADSDVKEEDIPKLDNHSKRPEIILAKERGKGVSIRYSASVGKELIYAAVPVKNSSNETIAYLRFASSFDYVSKIYQNIFFSILISFLIVLLASFFLAVFLSNLFYKPVFNLSKLVDDIINGSVPKTIVRKSPFEVGEIERKIEVISEKLFTYLQKMKSEKNILDSLLGNLSEGVLLVDKKNKIVFANKKFFEIFDIDMADIIGQNPRSVLRNNEIADIIEKNISGSSEDKDIDLVLYTPHKRYFNVSFIKIKDANNDFISQLVVFQDLTRIRELEQYRSDFIANVSHELKTPLSVIRSYVETLLSGALNDKNYALEFLQKIEKHAQNLTKLIDDIIMLSKLENKGQVKQIEKVDLNELIKKCIEDVLPIAQKKNIFVKFLEEDKVVIDGVNEQIYRAIINLMDNAVNYNKENGKVFITLKKTSKHAHIIIKDTGIGIPEESLQRIFERFYRVDQSRSRETGGTGLGLSIVKHIIELHNGQINVESILNQYTTFSVILPLQQV